MKRTGVIIISAVVFLLIGGLFLGWSAYKKSQVEKPAAANIQHFSDETFEKDVVETSKTMPVLVDFYAEWCFPCRMLEPILEEVANEMKGKAVIGKVNTDKNMIGRKFGISKIPAVFIIKNGEIKSAFYGVVPKETIVKALTE